MCKRRDANGLSEIFCTFKQRFKKATIMKKRDFIKKMSLATLASPLYASVLTSCVEKVANVPANDLASNNDFWQKVRSDYKLKPDYINLESGYYNIVPTPTLNKMVEHAKMVNYEGSYYMRTVQWDNKMRMAQKLAEVLGSTEKNVIITRNTTESLDMVIKGFPWKNGNEAVFAQQDYGAMKVMFE